MGSFFRGWRRKAGVVTLVMALAAFGLWVRSLIVYDGVAVSNIRLASRNGWVSWRTLPGLYADEVMEWETDVIGDDEDYLLPGDPSVEWQFQLTGLGMGWEQNLGHGRTYIRIACQWYFIVPLTLLSAYLLLWKPRMQRV
jgi:hypothetical protein